jgi:hypothetical protein
MLFVSTIVQINCIDVVSGETRKAGAARQITAGCLSAAT